MTLSQFSVCAVALAAILIPFSSAKTARADTYNIVSIESDKAHYFYGMDDAGHVAFQVGDFVSQIHCGPAAMNCYETLTDGSNPTYSTTAPAFSGDTSNSSCPPIFPPNSQPVVKYTCNNMRGAFYNYDIDTHPGLYVATLADPTAQNIFQGFLTGGVWMDGMGDIVFDEGVGGIWYEAFDLNSRVATTPEPASLLLLATGLVGGVLFFRRRASSAQTA